MSNRETAEQFLSAACGTKRGSRATASALAGIGYALLEIADAARDSNKGLMTMADLNAWTDRLIAANREAIAANSAFNGRIAP